jgi:hypothetical protein
MLNFIENCFYNISFWVGMQGHQTNLQIDIAHVLLLKIDLKQELCILPLELISTNFAIKVRFTPAVCSVVFCIGRAVFTLKIILYYFENGEANAESRAENSPA